MKKPNPFEAGFQGTFGVIAALICIVLFWWAIPFLLIGLCLAVVFVGIPWALWYCLCKLLDPRISWSDWIGWFGCAVCIATAIIAAFSLHSAMAVAFALFMIGGMILAATLVTHLSSEEL